MEPSIEKWGRENYPRLMTNPKAIELLYKKRVLNQATMTSQITAYPYVKVAELQVGKPTTSIITKIDCSVRELDVCDECHRRVCEHTNQKRIPFFIVKMLGGDDSSTESFQFMSTNKEQIDILEKNEEFIVTGRVNVDEKWGREFRINSFASLTKNQLVAWDELTDWAEIHGGDMGVSAEEFEGFVNNGRKEFLEPFFERIYVSRANGRIKW